jgi:hypothetical protein
MFLFPKKQKNSRFSTVENYILFVLIILCVLFSGLRYETGSDWNIYYDMFKNADNYWSSHFESGYIYFNYLFSTLNVNYSLFLILISGLYALLYYLLESFACNKWIFGLFLYSNIYVLFWGGNRQAIALVLGCVGTICFLKKTRFLSAFYWLLAIQFHISSLTLPLISFCSNKFRLRIVVVSSFLINLLILINRGQNPLVQLISYLLQGLNFVRLSSYLDGTEYLNPDLDYGTRNIIILLSNTITLLSFVLFGDKLIKLKAENKSFLIICSVYYAIFALSLGISQNLSGRMIIFGRPFEAIIISYLPYVFKSNLAEKNVTIFIVIAMLLKIYFTFITQGFYLPYQSIL